MTRNAEPIVTIREEYEHMLNYLEIQKLRFCDRVQVEIGELPEQVANLKIPKLCLQPIAENAYKYAFADIESGGVFRVLFRREDNRLQIMLEDNGSALTDAQIDAINISLHQAQEASGLVNVARRLEHYTGGKGSLHAERSVLGGLAIVIDLRQGGMTFDYRILVVDDETNIADGIAATLRTGLEIDADIHVCYGTQSAKEYAAEHYIDLIVCDINMPKQNGLSLCRELLAQYPDLKIIFLTGYSDFSYTYEAMKLPDVSYVLKLEDDNVLLDAVRKKLRAQEEERHRRAELMRERQRSDRLAAQLSDLRFEKAVTLDGDMAYCGFVFLLMQFDSPSEACAPSLRGRSPGKYAPWNRGAYAWRRSRRAKTSA